jgi:hypothetical protein
LNELPVIETRFEVTGEEIGCTRRCSFEKFFLLVVHDVKALAP